MSASSSCENLLLPNCNSFQLQQQQLQLPEEVGYVQCSFCATILLVSVPSSNSSQLLKVVTVKCGHCTALLPVSLVRASSCIFPLHHLLAAASSLGAEDLGGSSSSSHLHDQPWSFPDGERKQEEDHIGAAAAAWLSFHDRKELREDDEEQEDDRLPLCSSTHVVNKPPERRQRAPSAYNRFIKEEIRRIKARDPNITHKEAFSTAAKSWAHLPRVRRKGDGDSCTR